MKNETYATILTWDMITISVVHSLKTKAVTIYTYEYLEPVDSLKIYMYIREY
jgi:hypothetical protein